MTDEQEPAEPEEGAGGAAGAEPEAAAEAEASAEPEAAAGLVPARYEPSDLDAASFAPKLPWRLMVTGALVLVSVIGGYFYRQHVQLTALRESIVGEYVRGVEPDARRLRGFRQELEDMIIDAASRAPETEVAPELHFSAMHDARGLYLRIRAADAGSREDIARGSSRMLPDAFTRCLGLAPTSLRGLFERGEFLSTSWPERLREANTSLRLRVIQDELRRHIRRDLPLFTELLDADYFLLTLERGDGVFDVFLWDLHHGQLLLRTRARPSGLLVPVRIDFEGVQAPRYRRQPHPVGAAECSIAASLKALTGEDTMTFGSHLPSQEVEPAAESAPDAGTDAQVATDAGAMDAAIE
ncbi:MAG: hypothetical protein GXP55_06135 [Deltaproteobacteria bacterium]|nr:hypothetical protein [Deltaproteobacteria bacterium]